MKEIPLAINFKRLKDYLIPPDEIVLFEWFLFKQYYFGVSSTYRYSRAKIEEDTHIGRRKQETIVQKFINMGFLDCVAMHDKKSGSLTNHFRINYDALKNDDILSKIVKKDSETYDSFQKYFCEIAPF